jgi:hypothetical protein
MGYTMPPGKPKKRLNLSYKKENNTPTLPPAIATPSAVARYLEKWVEMLESDG